MKSTYKKTSILIVIILAIATLMIIYACANLVKYSSNINNDKNLKVVPTVQKLSKEDVYKNNTLNNCLVIYNNQVYKIPEEYLKTHDNGNSKLIQDCGGDITYAIRVFEHPPEAYKILAQFYYAQLKD